MHELLRNFGDAKVAVVGDIILDRYTFCTPDRISVEAPVLIVRQERDEYRLGGAANVAANIRSMGGQTKLFGVVGRDDTGKTVRTLLKRWGIDYDVMEDAGRQTTVKQRIIVGKQQIVRVDSEDRYDIPDEIVFTLGGRLRQIAQEGYQSLIIQDYGKGMVNRALMYYCPDDILVLLDPKVGQDDSIFEGRLTAIVPNKPETDWLLRGGGTFTGLFDKFGVEVIVETLGASGVQVIRKGGEVTHFPATGQEACDVTGAGDTFIAVLAMARSSGLSWEDAAWVANVAAGISVGKVGTATVSMVELSDALQRYKERG